jgi:hypothetical protein
MMIVSFSLHKPADIEQSKQEWNFGLMGESNENKETE